MNSFVQALRLEAPLIQAPMAGFQGHALAAATCEAGALGSVPAALFTPEALHEELRCLRALTGRAFNVNFFAHTNPEPDAAREARWRETLAPYYREAQIDPASIAPGALRAPFNAAYADAIESYRPAVVSFHFGLPSAELLARVKGWNAWVVSTATTVEEGVWLERHGADAVIAQGLEAGGHRGHFLSHDLSLQMGTLALVPQLVRALSVPVIAAGGIADAAGVRAVLALGACAAQLGSAYLLCPEASTTLAHRTALKSPQARHTALTNLFSGRAARGIVNRLMRELGPFSDRVPEFPLASSALAPLRARAERAGEGDFSPLWCGQNAAPLREMGAFDLTRSLASEID